MTEYNIFEIVRSEKKNLSSVSIPQLNKVFVKYYLKFMLDLYYKFINDTDFKENDSIDFENNIDSIGNFIFHIFYTIYLSCFNIHISLFFLERASLLFYEFISLSIKEKDYKIESNSYINDAIIFTYKKTIGNITLEDILNENKNNKDIKNLKIYQNILQVRNISFLVSKIIHKIILSNEGTEKYKKIYKNITETLLKIYLTIDIDKFLFQQINRLLNEYTINIAILLIVILIDTIREFIDLDFFEFNTQQSDLDNFINYLELFFNKFLSNNDLDLLLNTDLKKNKIYMEFKDSVLRYISN